MRFDLVHKAVAYLTAGLGLAALSLGAELALPVKVAIAAGFVGSWFVEGPILRRPAYARFWNVAVMAAFGVQVLRAVLGAAWLTLGIEYAALLQLSRLFHRRSAREYQHVAVLAFLHLIAATVLTTGLDYAFVFLGFVVVTPWMLALTQLRADIEENYGVGSAGPSPDDPHLDRVLRSRRLTGPRFLLGTALLALPLFLVTAGLFLLIPRVGMGFLSFRTDAGQPVAGFGRNVELGGFGVIRDDPSVVMRVRTPGRDGSRRRTELRMRGTSFDYYDGRRWTRTPLPGEPLPRMFDRYALIRWPEPEDVELSIVLDPLDEPVVFLPEGTVALSVPPRVRGGRDVGRRLVRAPGLDLRYVDGDGLGLVYSAHVARDGKGIPGELSGEARERYLQLPEGHERVARLAREITAGASGERERITRILTYLRESGRYAYDLRLPDVDAGPPLEAFLFEARRGHCEYFSTAMAILLRAVGVPARNVTGFVGGRYNRFGDYYAIRQGDAHSWVEAHVDGRWETFDPTPSARHAVGPDEGMLDGVRALLDALRTRWATHVVGYDLRDQGRALRRVMRWMGLWRVRRADGEERHANAESRPAPAVSPEAGGVAAGAAGIVLAVFAVGWLWRRRRSPPRDPAVVLYRRLDARLRRAGRPRPPSVTPRAHALQLEQEGHPHAPVVREVTEAYLAARYAGRPLTPDQTSRLARAIRRI